MSTTTSDSSGPVSHKVPDKIIGFKEKLGYGAGDMASVLFFKVFSSYLMFFYTEMVGVAAATVSTMFWVTRIFDAVNDPLMGIVSDKTDTKYGKFRPWLIWSVVPFSLSGILVFTVPEFENQTMTIVYMYVTYTLAMIFYTMINIPYGSLMGVMTPNSSERTTLASFRFAGAFLANLIVQGSILFLAIKLGGSEDGEATQAGYRNAVIIFGIAAAALFLFTFSSTKERVKLPKGQESNVMQDLKLLLSNKPWVAIVFIGISTVLWIAMRDAAILYYIKYYVLEYPPLDSSVEVTAQFESEFATLATWFPVVGTLATLIGLFFTEWMTRVCGGKRNAYIISTLLSAGIAFGFYFSDQGDLKLIFVIQILTSFFSAPLMPLFWAMIADTADYSEWKYHRRFTGLTFSAGTFSQKLGWAVGPALAGYALTYYGFQANQPQEQETINGLRLMISVIPSAIGFGAALLTLTYGINKKLEEQIERELAERKTAEGSLDA